MIVREVMNRQVVTTKPELSLRDASKAMTDMKIGSLLVVEEQKILGIITSADILKALASGKDTDRTLVEGTMSKDVKTVDPGKTIEEAVDLMMQYKIRELPVVEEEKLVGIITASDIVTIEPKLIANIASLMSMRLPGYSGG